MTKTIPIPTTVVKFTGEIDKFLRYESALTGVTASNIAKMAVANSSRFKAYEHDVLGRGDKDQAKIKREQEREARDQAKIKREQAKQAKARAKWLIDREKHREWERVNHRGQELMVKVAFPDEPVERMQNIYDQWFDMLDYTRVYGAGGFVAVYCPECEVSHMCGLADQSTAPHVWVYIDGKPYSIVPNQMHGKQVVYPPGAPQARDQTTREG